VLAVLLAACSNLNAPAELAGLEAQAAAGERYVVIFKKNEVAAASIRAIEAAGGTVVRTLP
jgi:lantibiotic leader peptide-processing serine protease